jgi:hypothetical protein
MPIQTINNTLPNSGFEDGLTGWTITSNGNFVPSLTNQSFEGCRAA